MHKAECADCSGPGAWLAVRNCLVMRYEPLCGIYLAKTPNLPYSVTDAGDHDAYDHAEQRSRPFLNACSRPHADDPASVGHAKPRDERVTQGARRTIHDEEASARDSQRAGGEDKG